MTTKKKFNLYENITERFIASLKEGTIPWHKTWSTFLPKNFVSGNVYKGINLLLLSSVGEEWYLTNKQVKDLKGTITDYDKKYIVVYFKIMEGKDKKTGEANGNTFPLLRYSTVYPQSVIEGIDFPKQERDNNPIEDCEKIVKKNKPVIKSGKPSYSPSGDTIQMPDMSAFHSSEEYYHTLFHEMTHWTGSTTRLKRDLSTLFGSHDYSFEELVAELGASFISAQTGIENDKMVDNSKAYIQSWIKKLESDPQMIVRASTKAQQATRYLTEYKNAKVGA
jgi:antirestriction protein ArdC